MKHPNAEQTSLKFFQLINNARCWEDDAGASNCSQTAAADVKLRSKAISSEFLHILEVQQKQLKELSETVKYLKQGSSTEGSSYTHTRRRSNFSHRARGYYPRDRGYSSLGRGSKGEATLKDIA